MDGEKGPEFGQAELLDQVLDFLTDDLRLLVREGKRYHFTGLSYPAQGVSLNAADMDNVVIMDTSTGTVLGEVYEGAIYGHQGEQYRVEEFHYADRRANVRRVDVDYYTEADTETEVRLLHVDETVPFATHEAHRSEVHVSTLARAFKKIRFYTRENVGIGEINLPPEEFETEACILALEESFAVEAGLHRGADADGLRGVGELIQGLVPLFVRVDPADVKVSTELCHPHFDRPTITIYDQIPNGVGLSEKIFSCHREILQAALGLTRKCACTTGCPACIGPSRDQGRRGKGLALAVLTGLLR